MAKQRVKNKQELSPKSGVKKKPEYRDKIIFEFEVDKVKYRNGEQGRIKIDKDGFISFLTKTGDKWQNKKGQFLQLKLIKERKKSVGNLKKNVSRKHKKTNSVLSTASQTK